MSINPLSIEDLMARKDEVVEAHNEAMNDLEQKYFSDVTQLYRIKQAMQCQLQTSLMDSLHEINTMIKQKMGTHSHYNNTSNSSNSVISLASPPMISTSAINGHHSHRSKSKHYSSGRPKPPSFSSHPNHHNHHRHNVLPISSLPVIQAPSVPLSTSIDAILHHKQHQVPSPLLNRKKKRRKSNGLSFNANGATDYMRYGGDIAPDPMSLDFNLVTVPDEILNDVKSIVANNNARHKRKTQNLPKKPRAPAMYHNNNNSNYNNNINYNNNSNYNNISNHNNNSNYNNSTNYNNKRNYNNSNNREESNSVEEVSRPSINTANNHMKQDTKPDFKGQIKGDMKGDMKPDTLECSLCHQAFDTQLNLNAHLNSAHSFKCDLCSKSFQKRIDLKRHQRLHEGVKVYECKICYKTYRSPGSLHNHMRLHEVSNLFTCSYCKKGFTQSHHLKRHLRIHTGVTPFRCRYCERPFKYNTSCRRHERTVHKDVYRPETPGDTINNPDAVEDALALSNNDSRNNKNTEEDMEDIEAENDGDDDEETEHEV